MLLELYYYTIFFYAIVSVYFLIIVRLILAASKFNKEIRPMYLIKINYFFK